MITADRNELAVLSDTDRAELAHFLIQSLQPQADADVESAWDAELERRGNQIRTGQAAGEPAEKVFSELRGVARAPQPIIDISESEKN
jgi:putative addiction module component (TIGR02574 family)